MNSPPTLGLATTPSRPKRGISEVLSELSEPESQSYPELWCMAFASLVRRLWNAVLYVLCGVEREPSIMSQQIAPWHAKLECHHVTTQDGNVLALHRIVHRVPHTKGPILLQHGLFESSVVWTAQGSHSLAHRLLEQGYDVWCGNTRGNVYSSGLHGLWGSWSLWGSQSGSFVDTVTDFNLCVRHIIQATGFRKLVLIGQSQGAVQPLVAMEAFPMLADQIELLVLLSPALCLKKPSNGLLRAVCCIPAWAYHLLLPAIALLQCVCPARLLVVLGGKAMRSMQWVNQPYDEDSARVLFCTTPSGSGCVGAALFWIKQFSTGAELECDLRRADCRVVCYLGEADGCVDAAKTACRLRKDLPHLEHLQIQPGYAHADFIWTRDASISIYPDLLRRLPRRLPRRFSK